MAYPDYTSSDGLKTTTTIKSAGTTGVGVRNIIIQNHATAILKIKFGENASTSNYDIILKACSVAEDGSSLPVVLENVSDAQVISCWAAGTPSYTLAYR
jgi:hypothetical protein